MYKILEKIFKDFQISLLLFFPIYNKKILEKNFCIYFQISFLYIFFHVYIFLGLIIFPYMFLKNSRKIFHIDIKNGLYIFIWYYMYLYIKKYMESDIIKVGDSSELCDIINESIEKVISEGGNKEFYRRLYSDIFGIGDL